MENRYRTVVVEARREPRAAATGFIASDIFTTNVSYTEPGGRSISGVTTVLSVTPC